MIIGMADKPGTRQVFEEIFADELRKRGIKAVASYTIESLRTKPDRQAFKNALASTGAQALLTSRVADIKEKRHEEAGYVMTDRGTAIDYDYYDYYLDYTPAIVSYATFDSRPVDLVTSSTTFIESSLFDAATGKVVWKGKSSETDADDLLDSTKTLAGLVADALAKAALIK